MVPGDAKHTALLAQMAEYDKMMENPAQYEARNPDKTWEEYVELHESFYLLEPLEEMWGRWVMFKCSCPGFFGAACCGHSSLLALLYDSSLEFPSECSSRQLPGRAGKT